MPFPEFTIQGGPRERGQQYGEQLANRIRDTRDFYADIFQLPEATVFERAEQFREAIRQYNDDYVTEIEAIAEASGVDARWIYALNSRTEILSEVGGVDLNECTSMYFRPTSILAQTWDWGRRMESLIVVLRIVRPDGHSIRMICEPGIIGKIGLNSAGVGCCLNLLRCGPLKVGVPVHIVLRAILDSGSIDEARQEVERAGGSRASNILVGGVGDCFDVEFANDEKLIESPPTDVVCHTNHYLVRDGLDEPGFDLSSSLSRLRVARERGNDVSDFSLAQMTDVLDDQSDRELPILRPYAPDDIVQEVGTVCTVLMDLPQRRLHVRKGNNQATTFECYSA